MEQVSFVTARKKKIGKVCGILIESGGMVLLCDIVFVAKNCFKG